MIVMYWWGFAVVFGILAWVFHGYDDGVEERLSETSVAYLCLLMACVLCLTFGFWGIIEINWGK